VLTIAQAETEAQVAATAGLLREYFEWQAASEPDDFNQADTFRGIDLEISTLPGDYAPPAGRLLLASVDGQPAGCVGLKRHAAASAELKRLYVRPAFRGLHIGWQLVNRLLAEARQGGYERVLLDTHIRLKSALAIYHALGFQVVPPPDDFPALFKPVVIFMEYNLLEAR
jgi:putative acetyltransferase